MKQLYKILLVTGAGLVAFRVLAGGGSSSSSNIPSSAGGTGGADGSGLGNSAYMGGSHNNYSGNTSSGSSGSGGSLSGNTTNLSYNPSQSDKSVTQTYKVSKNVQKPLSNVYGYGNYLSNATGANRLDLTLIPNQAKTENVAFETNTKFGINPIATAKINKGIEKAINYTPRIFTKYHTRNREAEAKINKARGTETMKVPVPYYNGKLQLGHYMYGVINNNANSVTKNAIENAIIQHTYTPTQPIVVNYAMSQKMAQVEKDYSKYLTGTMGTSDTAYLGVNTINVKQHEQPKVKQSHRNVAQEAVRRANEAARHARQVAPKHVSSATLSLQTPHTSTQAKATTQNKQTKQTHSRAYLIRQRRVALARHRRASV